MSGPVGSGPVGLEFLGPEVVEAALSVLARKTRAELMLGLLEEFAAGRRSGRAVLVDARLALVELTPREANGVLPEWERLRQVGRAKGEPVVEWEIVHGLDVLLRRAGTGPETTASPRTQPRSAQHAGASVRQRRGRGTPRRHALSLSARRLAGEGRQTADNAPQHPGLAESGMSLDALESAMDLAGPGGLGVRWSLNAYLVETRDRLGRHVHPREPDILAATLLRIDHARQLLKPGGLSFDVGVVEPQQADLHTVNPSAARDIFARYRETLGPQLAAAAGVQMLRGGLADRNGVVQENPDVERAVAAGEKIVAAQRARAKADDARDRAAEVRGLRVSASGNAVYLTGAAGVALGAGIGLSAGLRADLAGLVGVGAGAITFLGRGLQDWEQSKEPLIAPFRAWWTARRADRADRAAEAAVQSLFHSPTGQEPARQSPTSGRGPRAGHA